jgi:uncharacterized membrane protein
MRKERAVARLLRAGVIVSLALIAAGLAFSLATPGAAPRVAELGLLMPPDGPLAETLTHLGLLVLMLTPALRLFLLGWLFAREGNRPFVALTIVVLFILIATIAMGLLQGGTG